MKKIIFAFALLVVGLVFGFLFKAKVQSVIFKPASIQVYSLSEEKEMDLFDAQGSAAVVLFWNSQCEPCKIEMGRLQTAISSGKIPGGAVLAVNLEEPIEVVRDFALTHDYQFQYFSDLKGEALKQYKVPGTPTEYYFNKRGQVVWSAMGLIPESIQQAEKLFAEI
ncbi:MAG: TlpA family protein disulfide reductase [Pseudobdellovibrionaceae bacterium]